MRQVGWQNPKNRFFCGMATKSAGLSDGYDVPVYVDDVPMSPANAAPGFVDDEVAKVPQQIDANKKLLSSVHLVSAKQTIQQRMDINKKILYRLLENQCALLLGVMQLSVNTPGTRDNLAKMRKYTVEILERLNKEKVNENDLDKS